MKIKIALISLLLGIFLFASPSLAQSAKPTSTPPIRRGLTEVSMRACQAREAAVKTRMDSLIKLATNIEEKFDAIATRVKNFYTNKVLPTGRTVSSYDTLVADIATKKNVTQTDLTTVQGEVNAFSCTSDDPRGLLTQFRINMQKVKSDLKDYRTAIKNLIVAVHKIAPTPEPTATP